MNKKYSFKKTLFRGLAEPRPSYWKHLSSFAEQVASLCSLVTLIRAAQIDRETETLGILTVPRRLALLPTVGFQEILLVPYHKFPFG